MEGNSCYKFSTIAHYVRTTGARPIRTILDVGANVGNVSLEMAKYFPAARIFGFEAVEEYYLEARRATSSLPNIHIFHAAVTSQHRFMDATGAAPLPSNRPLQILKALPAGGPGWRGGSVVAASADGVDASHYRLLNDPVVPLTLDEVVGVVGKLSGEPGIDIAKFDCEGCECSSLGCASEETLRLMRFIVGEYHGIDRFFEVMEKKLFRTHYVNLIGDAQLGAFFAENIAESAGILDPDRETMRIPRPWLSGRLLEWNVFRRDFVIPGEEADHAL